MKDPSKQVEFMDRRIAVQAVIDRIIEHGQDYVRHLDMLNQKFELSGRHQKISEDVRND